MRRSPARLRPSVPFRGGWVLVLLILASSATAQAPPKKKAAPAPPPPDTSPLARYVPKDDLVLYFEFSGLDAHSVAWQKTAAYRMLNETSLGAMLEDLGTQLTDKVLNMRPGRKLSGAEVVTIVKHLARSGFAFGVAHGPQKPDDSVAMMVIRGGARRESRGPFGRLIGSFAGSAGKPQVVKMGGERSVVIMPGTSPKQKWAWWSEKNDLVLAAQPPGGKDNRGAERIIEVLDGKRPGAVGHPIYVELAKAKGAFEPVGLGFMVPVELPPDAAAMKTTLDHLGLRGIQRIEYQWGLEGDALMSVTRVMAPRPRRGLLSLYDQPTFEKGALPPLPEEIPGFRVASIDLPKSLDTLMVMARALGGPVGPRADNLIENFKKRTRLDLRKDVLAHIGPKMALYISPGKPEVEIPQGTDAGGGLGGAAGGFNLDALVAAAVKVPRFTLVAEVKDGAAFGGKLAQLIIEANKGLREWRAADLNQAQAAKDAAAAAAAGPEAKTKKAAPAPAGNVAAPFFQLTESGDTKAYVLVMPRGLPRLPGGIRPSIRLGARHIVVSVSPEAAKQALEEKASKWTPSADLVPVFDRLPASLISLSISDPRPTLPASLASLPATLQKTINTALLQAQARPPADAAAPENAGPATITLEVDPAKMPRPEALKALLFPGSSAVSVDDQSIQLVRRGAFPEIGSTSPAVVMGMALPAIQAARKAAVKAGAVPPVPDPGAPAPATGAPAANSSQRPISPR